MIMQTLLETALSKVRKLERELAQAEQDVSLIRGDINRQTVKHYYTSADSAFDSHTYVTDLNLELENWEEVEELQEVVKVEVRIVPMTKKEQDLVNERIEECKHDED